MERCRSRRRLRPSALAPPSSTRWAAARADSTSSIRSAFKFRQLKCAGGSSSWGVASTGNTCPGVGMGTGSAAMVAVGTPSSVCCVSVGVSAAVSWVVVGLGVGSSGSVTADCNAAPCWAEGSSQTAGSSTTGSSPRGVSVCVCSRARNAETTARESLAPACPLWVTTVRVSPSPSPTVTATLASRAMRVTVSLSWTPTRVMPSPTCSTMASACSTRTPSSSSCSCSCSCCSCASSSPTWQDSTVCVSPRWYTVSCCSSTCLCTDSQICSTSAICRWRASVAMSAITQKLKVSIEAKSSRGRKLALVKPAGGGKDEVDDGLVRGHGALLHEERVEVVAAGGEHGLVGAVLLALNQQRDVTELVAEALAVQLVQHGLAVTRQELEVQLLFSIFLLLLDPAPPPSSPRAVVHGPPGRTRRTLPENVLHVFEDTCGRELLAQVLPAAGPEVRLADEVPAPLVPQHHLQLREVPLAAQPPLVVQRAAAAHHVAGGRLADAPLGVAVEARRVRLPLVRQVADDGQVALLARHAAAAAAAAAGPRLPRPRPPPLCPPPDGSSLPGSSLLSALRRTAPLFLPPDGSSLPSAGRLSPRRTAPLFPPPPPLLPEDRCFVSASLRGLPSLPPNTRGSALYSASSPSQTQKQAPDLCSACSHPVRPISEEEL
ncbi:LOW QUALITY PROTEIN: hypothetical protein CRUP_000016 [Coryphaenoides rupestris]|nr:LOW QUALITY PROTEIN: hypothetical protein CRUP_000016 [Coryphaenoides rupestris]